MEAPPVQGLLNCHTRPAPSGRKRWPSWGRGVEEKPLDLCALHPRLWILRTWERINSVSREPIGERFTMYMWSIPNEAGASTLKLLHVVRASIELENVFTFLKNFTKSCHLKVWMSRCLIHKINSTLCGEVRLLNFSMSEETVVFSSVKILSLVSSDRKQFALLWTKQNKGRPSRWQRNKMWRSPSSPQIHQKYI